MRPEDLQIEAWSSAPDDDDVRLVRITHLPTGLSAEGRGRSELKAREAAMERLNLLVLAAEHPYVAGERPTDGFEDPLVRADVYYEVIESLIGGLDYRGVVAWLDAHPDLASAWRNARRLRDSPAT